jgi:hypothetical protein
MTRSIRTAILVAATATLGLAAGASAQERPCMADAARICPNVEPGEGAQIACLKAHKEDLSPACKRHVMQTKIKREEQNQLEQQRQQEGLPPQQGMPPQ